MPSFQLSLVSPEKPLFAGPVDQVDLPGVEGDFGVLAGHAPIVAMLRPGIVIAIAGGAHEKFVVFGGVAEFSREVLTSHCAARSVQVHSCSFGFGDCLLVSSRG